MCIQDPFVLSHNTSSNVTDKQAVHIIKQFHLAAVRCRHSSFTTFTHVLDNSSSDCSQENTEADRGLVYLLSLGPITPNPISVSSSTSDATKRSQLEPAVQSFSVKFSMSKLATDSSCREAGNIDAVRNAWCADVNAVIRSVLVEVLDFTCTTRSKPSLRLQAACHLQDTFSSSYLSSHKSAADAGQRVLTKRTLVCDGDTYMRDTGNKRLKADSDCRNDDNVSERDSTSMNCLTQVTSISSAHDVVSSSNGSPSSATEYIFCADCSTSRRLWFGRKKIRHQLFHVTQQYEREVLVTKALKANLPQSSSQLPPILEFEIVIFCHPTVTMDTITIAMLPTRETVSEFSCFVLFFKSCIMKLVGRCVTGASRC